MCQIARKYCRKNLRICASWVENEESTERREGMTGNVKKTQLFAKQTVLHPEAGDPRQIISLVSHHSK